MKLGKIVNGRLLESIKKLSETQLPIKTAFKLKGIAKLLRDEAAKHEELRVENLNKHGIKEENGALKLDARNNVLFNEEGLKKFVADMEELASLEIEVPQITLSELGDGIVISSEELEVLEGIVVE
jgi:hypothetical protein